MAKDNLDMLSGAVNKKLGKDNGIDKSSQQPVAIHIGYYKLMKLYCAIHGESMVNIMDEGIQRLIDSGYFDDVKGILDNKNKK